MRAFEFSLLVLALTACATFTPVETGYTGPTATLEDSYQWAEGESCGSFFFLYQYNGHVVDNAVSATSQANAGRGLRMIPNGVSRPIPTSEAMLTLIGRTHCAAPILEFTGMVYFLQGDVKFEPEAGATYVIKGELAPDHSAVWIEDRATHAQIGNKLFFKGLAKINYFKRSGPVEQIPPGQ